MSITGGNTARKEKNNLLRLRTTKRNQDLKGELIFLRASRTPIEIRGVLFTFFCGGHGGSIKCKILLKYLFLGECKNLRHI